MPKTGNHSCKMAAILFLITLWALSGCATPKKSIGLGGAIGGTTGAIMGGISYPGKNGIYRTRNVIVGAALGTAAGMLAGKLFHNNVEEEKNKAFEKGKASAPQAGLGAVPSLSNPQIESRWVEGKIIGNRYVEGHFEYIIIEPARWQVDE